MLPRQAQAQEEAPAAVLRSWENRPAILVPFTIPNSFKSYFDSQGVTDVGTKFSHATSVPLDGTWESSESPIMYGSQKS